MPKRDPLQQQFFEARRNQILDAATKVFAAKGFHRATIQDIAETAGLSHGAIYTYFDSKDALLMGLLARLAELQKLDLKLTQGVRTDTYEFLTEVFRHRADLVKKNQETIQAVLPEMLTQPDLHDVFYEKFVRPTEAILEQYLRAQIRLGLMKNVNVKLTARVVHSLFIGLIIMRMLDDETLLAGWEELPELLTTLIFEGLKTNEP
jgi:AcrR family transcriptional regulator